MKKLILLCALAATAVVMTACAGMSAALLKPTVTAQTVTQTNFVNQIVPVILTNYYTMTNNNGNSRTLILYQTNLVAEPVPVLVTNQLWVTNYAVAPGVANGIATAQAINSATSLFNPFSGTLAAVFGLASAGLGFLVKQKNAQIATHASVNSTIISAIEGLEPAVAAGVKAAVASEASKQGTAAAVFNTVQAVTQNL